VTRAADGDSRLACVVLGDSAAIDKGNIHNGRFRSRGKQMTSSSCSPFSPSFSLSRWFLEYFLISRRCMSFVAIGTSVSVTTFFGMTKKVSRTHLPLRNRYLAIATALSEQFFDANGTLLISVPFLSMCGPEVTKKLVCSMI
jgi:hypothetical protein